MLFFYMKILVTGGSGLVGRSLQNLVSNEWYFISTKDVNLLSYTDTVQYFSNINPDVIVHLAARVGGLFNNINNNEDMLVDNLTINTNVIKAAEKCNTKRLILMLSTCIFPDKQLPLTEDMIHHGPPHYSNEGYAIAKRVLEVHARLSKIETICLIPTNLFGPYDNFNLQDGHVIPALIHKCYLSKQNFQISGSGNPLRQFLYNGDMAKIIKWAVEKKEVKNNHELFICSSDEEISIHDLAKMIAKIMNTTLENNNSDTKDDGQYRKTASNKLLKSAFTELQFSNFEEKLEETIKWFIKNYDYIRK